jgi:arginase
MHIDVIGVPIDFGSGRRGVDMGPSAIRYAGLQAQLEALGHTVTDHGNILVPPSETCTVGEPRMKYLDPIVQVEQRLADRVAELARPGQACLVLGGDHSVALGSVSGAARGRRLGLVWLDTHGDFNTAETTPSGNVHGMPLAALCGYGDPRLVTLGGTQDAEPKILPENLALIGTRDLDPGERDLMEKAGVSVFSMSTVDRLGIAEVVQRAIEIASRGTDGIYVSLDLDVLDPKDAPGVGTPSPGGLTHREAHLAMEMLCASGKMVGLDVVEVNPILDQFNSTARQAVELTASAFGKRTWND